MPLRAEERDARRQFGRGEEGEEEVKESEVGKEQTR
jgi:hypothetical protein